MTKIKRDKESNIYNEIMEKLNITEFKSMEDIAQYPFHYFYRSTSYILNYDECYFIYQHTNHAMGVNKAINRKVNIDKNPQYKKISKYLA